MSFSRRLVRCSFVGMMSVCTVVTMALCGCSKPQNDTKPAETQAETKAATSKAATNEQAETKAATPKRAMAPLTAVPEGSKYGKGTHHVAIEVADKGTINLELYADIAPITVSNFCSLVEQGFYNGLTFHRIIKNFVVQGGDPLGTGRGGSPQTIKGEFSSNGVANSLLHTRGAISMARSSDFNSASSQFFIMHKDAPSLDGQYAAFGRVTSGMEVVDNLAENTVAAESDGTVAKENQPKIASIRIV